MSVDLRKARQISTIKKTANFFFSHSFLYSQPHTLLSFSHKAPNERRSLEREDVILVFRSCYLRAADNMASHTQTVPDGMENFVVGLIGMGDMGKMYAERLSAAGWR